MSDARAETPSDWKMERTFNKLQKREQRKPETDCDEQQPQNECRKLRMPKPNYLIWFIPLGALHCTFMLSIFWHIYREKKGKWMKTGEEREITINKYGR